MILAQNKCCEAEAEYYSDLMGRSLSLSKQGKYKILMQPLSNLEKCRGPSKRHKSQKFMINLFLENLLNMSLFGGFKRLIF